MAPITHQAITDRINAMREERDRLLDRHDKEIDSLVELCGGIGHRFDEPVWARHLDANKERREGWHWNCEVCGHGEWVFDGEEKLAAIGLADPPLAEAPPTTLTSEQAQRLVEAWVRDVQAKREGPD